MQVNFLNYECEVKVSKYTDGNTCLRLVSGGMPIATATVIAPIKLPPNHVVLTAPGPKGIGDSVSLSSHPVKQIKLNPNKGFKLNRLTVPRLHRQPRGYLRGRTFILFRGVPPYSI